MPQVFKIGPYWVYFWANKNDPLEPVHVHAARVRCAPRLRTGPFCRLPQIWNRRCAANLSRCGEILILTVRFKNPLESSDSSGFL